MLAPMAAGLALMQLLDRRHRVRIHAGSACGDGAVQLYQCSEQATSSNAMLIEQYEKDPSRTTGRTRMTGFVSAFSLRTTGCTPGTSAIFSDQQLGRIVSAVVSGGRGWPLIVQTRTIPPPPAFFFP